MRFPAVVLALAASCAAIKVGDKLPAVSLDWGFPPDKVEMGSWTAGKTSVIVGLPGAFTPTWSGTQVPGYLAAKGALQERGVDEVIIYCVNDGAVMKAWEKDQLTSAFGSEEQEGDEPYFKFLADTSGAFTRAVDLVLDHPGPMGVLGNARCKRFAMVVKDSTVLALAVSEGPDDPAGDDDPSASLADAMLVQIDALKGKSEL